MAYIGQGIKQGTFKVLDTSGNTYNGSNTTFSLGTQVGSAAQLIVSHDGVIQLPGTDYTLASGGASITFSTAPASGASIFIIEISGAVGGTVTPSDNSVGITQLNVSDGSNGQALTTNGSGTLSFSTISGTTINNNADNRVITGSGTANTLEGEANLTFNGSDLDLSDGNITNVGTVAADRVKGDADSDSYIDFPGSDIVTINTGDNIRFRIDDSGKLSSGGETSPDVTKGGITLNQVQFDDHIFSCKSSDIAHGMTSLAETDTFFGVKKYNASTGGVRAEFYGEAEIGAVIDARVTNGNSNTDTGATAGVMCKNSKKSSTTVGSHGNDDNMLVVTNADNARFIVKGDGDIYYDGADQGAYDSYDDAHMVRAFDLSHGNGTIDSKFDKFVAYNHEKLAELKLVGRQKDGTPNHFVNITGMQRLHNGAIWQQYEKHNQLLEAVYDLAKEAVGEEKANAILEKHEVKRLQ
jgi:hypothetical protein